MSTSELADLVVKRYLRENPDETVANASIFALSYIAHFVDTHMVRITKPFSTDEL